MITTDAFRAYLWGYVLGVSIGGVLGFAVGVITAAII